ncbi:MAG TPA: hypothetical protein VMY42_19090 [Thermoguttaceae bacterium]|nr:hypothetical protein [Thermoguttaceae bacterium]
MIGVLLIPIGLTVLSASHCMYVQMMVASPSKRVPALIHVFDVFGMAAVLAGMAVITLWFLFPKKRDLKWPGRLGRKE